jgi:hypothetical protein
MAARYSFETARAHELLAGRLTVTLRALGRKRHARLGEVITLAIGSRSVATARVVCRGTLILGPRGLLRVKAMPQAAEHTPRLAAVLGFPSGWDALYAWHAAHGLTAGDRLWRELIAWDAKTLEPVNG